MPMVDTVLKFPNKILSWDGDAKELPTKENQFIWVDTTARWKITDIAKFYQELQTMESAFGKLDQVIDSAVRTVIAGNYLREAVRNSDTINQIERDDALQTGGGDDEDELSKLTSVQTEYENIIKGREILSTEMLTAAKLITPQYGIEMIDIVVRQIRYSDRLTESVFSRMIKERNQQAQAYRSHGEGKKDELMGQLDNDQRRILSEAYATAEEIKGNADAESTGIYARAYERDPEFSEFWLKIESYRKTLPTFSKTITTDMEYFNYLYNPEGR